MRRILVIVFACTLLFTAGCSSDEQKSVLIPLRNLFEDIYDELAPYDGPENPLTGLPVKKDISKNRPFAISINNIKQAQPQHGVSQADIIYEVLAEGGITRMIALYQDVSDVGVIGSVRSARPYFLDLAQGHDAIFIHAGGSEDAYSAISSRGIANIDGVRGDDSMFYRDSYRRSANGYEHSLMTSSDLIADLAGSYGYRMEHEKRYEYKMEFSDDATPENGEAANEIDIKFSNYKTSKFIYDEESGQYNINQYNKVYVDGNTGDPVSAKNVLVLYATTHTLDEEGRLSMSLTGNGSGYFACNGQYIPINWHKSSARDQFIYTLEDGSNLVFGRGISYICIIPNSGTAAFR